MSRLLAIVEVLMCSGIPTQFAIAGILRAIGIAGLDASGQLTLPFVVGLSIGDTIALIALMVWITWAHGESVRELWLGPARPWREVALGILLVPAIVVAVVLLLNAMRVWAPRLHNVETNPLEALAGSPGNAALFAVVAIFAGGVREELQRAFLLRRFEQHLGGAAAGIVILGVGFGLGHFVQGWDAVITTGLLGVLWSVIYLRRRSVIAPVVSHSGFNSLEVLRVAVTVS
jgi:membrane protease YdiL (CAAX protease family)